MNARITTQKNKHQLAVVFRDPARENNRAGVKNIDFCISWLAAKGFCSNVNARWY
jgi:hypothetical protein